MTDQNDKLDKIRQRIDETFEDIMRETRKNSEEFVWKNIRSVEPFLGAMRTISLGSWQAALSRQQRIREYSKQLLSLLPAVLPHLVREQ